MKSDEKQGVLSPLYGLEKVRIVLTYGVIAVEKIDDRVLLRRLVDGQQAIVAQQELSAHQELCRKTDCHTGVATPDKKNVVRLHF